MYEFSLIHLLVPIAAVIPMLASGNLKSTVKKYSGIAGKTGITGQQTAALLLKANGITDVSIAPIAGSLTDHYANSAKAKQIALSEPVYGKTTITAIGVAAHEAGHAIQYAKRWPLIAIRNPFRRIGNFGSATGPVLASVGLAASLPFLLNIGILFFSAAVLLSLMTLPVEFNASKRALAQLQEQKVLTSQEEIKGAKKVLRAAALTYVAGSATAILNLLRLIFLSRSMKQKKKRR